MGDLASRSCVPCKGNVPPLKRDALARFAGEVPAWSIVGEHHLERAFSFADFRAALGFTNRIGEIAEAESHHPDLQLGWGRVVVTIWTHTIDGLTESDFILAAKIDRMAAASGAGSVR